MLAKNKSFLNSEHTQNNCKKAKCKTTFGTRDVQCPKLHYLTAYETSHAQWGIILLCCFDLINYYWKFAYASVALFIYIGKISQYAGTLKELNSRILLLCQLWIVNYSVKSSSNSLSNENINTGVSIVFKTKCKSKCLNELLLKYHFSGNTTFYIFITKIIWRTFDVIIDVVKRPWLKVLARWI